MSHLGAQLSCRQPGNLTLPSQNTHLPQARFEGTSLIDSVVQGKQIENQSSAQIPGGVLAV